MKKLLTICFVLLSLGAIAQPSIWGNTRFKLDNSDTSFTATANSLKSWLSLAGGGTVTSVDVSGGTTGLTYSGGPITSAGTITMAGTLGLANGGTNATTAAGARTSLNVDVAGTDNSTNVTLAGSLDYITIAGQVITRNAIDLAADVTGLVPIANGGTNASTAAGARTNLNVDVAGTDNSTNVTLAGTPDYITISGQVITRGLIDLTADVTGVGPVANGFTGLSAVGADVTLLGSNSTANIYYTLARTNIAAAIGWSRSGTTLNFNLPDADGTNDGIMNNTTQTIGGNKTWTGTHTQTGLITGNGGISGVSTASLAAIDAQGVGDSDFEVLSTTSTLDETNNFIGVGTLSGNITINLPACNGTRDGWEYRFIKMGSDSFAFILDPSTTETFFDGATTKSVYGQGNTAKCKCRSSDSTWFYSR